MQLGYCNSLIGQNRPRNSFVGALDAFTADLAGAWSVARRFLISYTGPLIRVRRDSDSDELDIGYSANGSLNQSALLSFAGAGSAYIKTVYDQGGGGVDYVQATAGNQPRIVNAGALETNEGVPAMRFIEASATSLALGSSIAARTWMTTVLGGPPSNPTYAGLITSTGSTYVMVNAGGILFPPGISGYSYFADGVDQTVSSEPFSNNVTHCCTITGDSTSDSWLWGSERLNPSRHWEGYAHEMLLYSTIPAFRADAETALMNLLGL